VSYKCFALLLNAMIHSSLAYSRKKDILKKMIEK
jgi:hypothetical protein